MGAKLLQLGGPAHYLDYRIFIFVSLIVEANATMPAISLTDLQHQIAQREQELQALREQLQARQSHLDELNRRKEQLQSDLRQIEEEIAALATTEARPRDPEAPAAPTVPPSPAPAARAEDQPRLGDLIITLLRESTTPMTGRQLLEEAQRRGFPSKSHDPLKAMENRLQVLKSKGVIRRAKSQYGFILASSTNGAKKKKSTTEQPAPMKREKTPAKPSKSEPAAKKSSGTTSSSIRAGKSEPSQREQPPLREVVTRLLEKTRKPQLASQLAAQALAGGYHTNSKNFINTVSALLTNMDNVKHIKGQGYLLQRNA